MTCAHRVVERDIEVVDIGADSVGVRLIGDCRGCGGCAGRCGLLDAVDGQHACLQREAFPDLPATGERWRLSLDESALRSAAVWGYGVPLAGMLAGGALGCLLGTVFESGINAATLLGAVAGTSLAFRWSKRAAPQALPIASRWEAADAVPPETLSAESTADLHNS